jgi:F-type H+-transporting ATPase subunit b
MDKRELSIQNDIQNANKNQKDIDNAQEEIGNILKKAREEADLLRQKATNKAIKEQEEELQKLREELDSKHIVFIQELDKDIQAYKKEMLSKIPKLKVSLDNKLSSIA